MNKTEIREMRAAIKLIAQIYLYKESTIYTHIN